MWNSEYRPLPLACISSVHAVSVRKATGVMEKSKCVQKLFFFFFPPLLALFFSVLVVCVHTHTHTYTRTHKCECTKTNLAILIDSYSLWCFISGITQTFSRKIMAFLFAVSFCVRVRSFPPRSWAAECRCALHTYAPVRDRHRNSLIQWVAFQTKPTVICIVIDVLYIYIF